MKGPLETCVGKDAPVEEKEVEKSDFAEFMWMAEEGGVEAFDRKVWLFQTSSRLFILIIIPSPSRALRSVVLCMCVFSATDWYPSIAVWGGVYGWGFYEPLSSRDAWVGGGSWSTAGCCCCSQRWRAVVVPPWHPAAAAAATEAPAATAAALCPLAATATAVSYSRDGESGPCCSTYNTKDAGDADHASAASTSCCCSASCRGRSCVHG